MSKYEVTIEWIDAQQAKLIKEMLSYDLWSKAEVKWKRKPIHSTFTLTGEGELTKELATEARKKYKKQFEADGHEIIKVSFKKEEDL